MENITFSNYKTHIVESIHTTLNTYIKENKDKINEEITTVIITNLNLWLDINKKENTTKNSYFFSIEKKGVIMKLSTLLRINLISSILIQLGFLHSDFKISDNGIVFEVYISIPSDH